MFYVPCPECGQKQAYLVKFEDGSYFAWCRTCRMPFFSHGDYLIGLIDGPDKDEVNRIMDETIKSNFDGVGIGSC